jgi:hypothetical protein
VGGPHEPYRQSQRFDIYADVVAKLKETGKVYESFSTAEEIEARNLAAGRDPKVGYDNFDRELTDKQKAAFRAEGREPALRLRVPDEDITGDGYAELVVANALSRVWLVPEVSADGVELRGRQRLGAPDVGRHAGRKTARAKAPNHSPPTTA